MLSSTRRPRRRITRASVAALALTGALGAAVRAAQAQRTTRADPPPAASDSLRLEDVLGVAERRSPRLAAARADARALAARVPSASLPPDPMLQLGLMNRALPSLAPMTPLGMTTIQLVQTVPLPGKLADAGRVAGARAAAATDRAGETRWDVRARAAMAFYDLYATTRAIDVAMRTREVLRDLASSASTMYAVGRGRQADVLRAQVEVAKMTEEVVRLRTLRSATAAQLDAVLDTAVAEPERAVAAPVFPDVLPPLDSLQRLALANRGFLRAARSEVDAAAAGESLARRAVWPDLAVGVQYGWRRGATGTEHMGSLMIGASVPIFARSRQLRLREAAAAEREAAAADLRALEADTRAGVAAVYADLARAHTLAALYRSTVLPQADAALAASVAAYRVGNVDFTTLADNQATVDRYQRELFALEADEGKALVQLERLTGHDLANGERVARRAQRETTP